MLSIPVQPRSLGRPRSFCRREEVGKRKYGRECPKTARRAGEFRSPPFSDVPIRRNGKTIGRLFLLVLFFCAGDKRKVRSKERGPGDPGGTDIDSLLLIIVQRHQSPGHCVCERVAPGGSEHETRCSEALPERKRATQTIGPAKALFFLTFFWASKRKLSPVTPAGQEGMTERGYIR